MSRVRTRCVKVTHAVSALWVVSIAACGGTEVGSRREQADGGAGGARAIPPDAGKPDAARPDAASEDADTSDPDSGSADSGPADSGDAADAAAPAVSAPWLLYYDLESELTGRVMAVRPTEPPLGPFELGPSQDPNAGCAAWSPDGARVFHLREGGTGYVTEMTDVGPGPTRTVGRGTAPWHGCHLAWSPDSRWLAFERAEGGGSQIVVWDLTAPSNAPASIRTVQSDPGVRSLAWSGDSTYLAHRTTSGTLTVLDFTADGRGTQVLPAPNVDAFFWSPSDSRLVIRAREPFMGQSVPAALHLVDLRDPALTVRRLGHPFKPVTFFGWSPLGRDAAWGLGHPAPSNVLLGIPGADPQGASTATVPANEERTAIWSSSGRHFATGNAIELGVVALDGSSRTLSGAEEPDFCPGGERMSTLHWLDDRRRLAVHATESAATETFDLPGLYIDSSAFSDSCDRIVFSGKTSSGDEFGRWASRLGSGVLDPITAECPNFHSWMPDEDRLLCSAHPGIPGSLRITAPVAGAAPLLLDQSAFGFIHPLWQPQQNRDVTPPSFPGCNAPTNVTASSATITWGPATDEGGATDIRYSVTLTDGDVAPLARTRTASVLGQTSTAFDGLSPATRYNVVCRATDLSNNTDRNAVLRSFTTLTAGTPPSFAGVTTVDFEAAGATLSWAPGTDESTPAGGITYVAFAASTSGAQDFSAPVAVSAPGATRVTVTGLDSDTEHWFVVLARDAEGNLDANRVEVSGRTWVSFGADVEPVLHHTCSQVLCHGGEDPSIPPYSGLRLDAGHAYDNLVDVNALHRPEGMILKRVDSTNPDPAASYLWRKISLCCPIEGWGAGHAELSLDQQESIRLWITQGARRE